MVIFINLNMYIGMLVVYTCKFRLGVSYIFYNFSFAEYYNPNNINFGVLRVINDDLVEANR